MENDELDSVSLYKLVTELEKLNNHLEDFKEMIAPLLGYRVIDKEERK